MLRASHGTTDDHSTSTLDRGTTQVEQILAIAISRWAKADVMEIMAPLTNNWSGQPGWLVAGSIKCGVSARRVYTPSRLPIAFSLASERFRRKTSSHFRLSRCEMYPMRVVLDVSSALKSLIFGLFKRQASFTTCNFSGIPACAKSHSSYPHFDCQLQVCSTEQAIVNFSNRSRKRL
jgi:hypothetical protein